MKLWTMTWMAFVMVFCFAIAAYAQETDKTEAAKIQAMAEAEAKLQPLETNIKSIFDETLKDRRIRYAEMEKFDQAVTVYQQALSDANQHLAIYKLTRESRAYQPAMDLHKLYFQNPVYGKSNQDKIRLLAAKEGVDLREIQTFVAFTQFMILLLLLIVGTACVAGGIKHENRIALMFGSALLVTFLILLIPVLS